MPTRSGRVAVATAIGLAAVVAAVVIVTLTRPGPRRPPTNEAVDLHAEVREFVTAQTSRGYLPADAKERETFGEGVAALLRQETDAAARVFQQIEYRVRVRVDLGGNRFAEAYDASGDARGWGRVLVDLRAAPRLVVEVPHPGADRGSELLGVAMSRRTPGAVLLIAGAYRRAASGADVAHATSSAFQSAHEEAVALGLPVVQLHGFAAESAAGRDVVVSAGPELRGTLAVRVANGVSRAGFAVCRSWVTECPGLEGTTNVQANWSDRHGGQFAHVEVAPDPRQNTALADRLAAALSHAACGGSV